MIETFRVPDLAEGLTEATIVEWYVAVGDTVTLNQPVCVVETAKASVEIPTPFAGTVAELGGAAGETLDVGAVLLRVDTAGVEGRRPTVERLGATKPSAGGEATLVGYGLDTSLDRSRRGSATRPNAPAPVPSTGGPNGRPRAKPPVRQLARRLGVDLDSLHPTGPEAIITRADVEAAANRRTAEAGSTSPRREDAPSPPPSPLVEQHLPVTGVRARIAAHLTASRHQIPDATCSVVVDCASLLAAVTAIDEAATRSAMSSGVTPFALICRLITAALVRHPELNASYRPEVPEIVRHAAVHLGVATATDRGLMVVVIRHAERRNAHDLGAELSRLVAKARDGTIAAAELVGSTITVSNFGALGIDEGIPIINHPEAAIIGVGAIAERPHVVAGAVAVRPTARITLAFDHRVCDGAEAAALLNTVRTYIEHPEVALASL